MRGKTSHDALRRLMDRETFLSARAALDAGLVDEIIGDEPQPGEPVNPANIFNAVGGLPDMDKLRAAYIEATKSQSPEGKTPEARAGEPAAPEGAVFNLNTGAIAIAEAEAALQRARAEL